MQNRKREEASEMFLGVELFSNQLMLVNTNTHLSFSKWIDIFQTLSKMATMLRLNFPLSNIAGPTDDSHDNRLLSLKAKLTFSTEQTLP